MEQNTMPNVHANSLKFCEYFLLWLLCVRVIPLFEYRSNNKFLYISSTLWCTPNKPAPHQNLGEIKKRRGA